MSTTTIPVHPQDNQNDNLLNTAPAEASANDNVVKFDPPPTQAPDQGPTKPLHLPLKERLRRIAQAIGFKASLLLLLTLTLGQIGLAQSLSNDDKLQNKAKELHKKLLAFDSHVDLPFEFGSPGLEATTDGKSQFDLVKAGKGGLKGAALAVFVSQGPRNAGSLARAKADAEKKHRIITGIAKNHPDRAAIAYTPDDVRRIAKEGKFVIVESFLNGWPIGNDISLLDEWHRKGVRIFGFVHAGHNDLTDSSRPSAPLGDKPEEHGGLSPLGKQAVAKLNELGVLIDVSQLSTKAFLDTLKLTKAPVAATHSAVRSIVDATRNLNDEELLALKANGGVIQIVAFSNYLRPLPKEVTEKVKALGAEYGLNNPAAQPLSEEKRKEYSDRYHDLVYAVPKATVGQLINTRTSCDSKSTWRRRREVLGGIANESDRYHHGSHCRRPRA